jgi:hypothetical protein
MKTTALIIGNNEYKIEKDKLNNAVNDATDLNRRLQTFGFSTTLRINCSREEFELEIVEFTNKLGNYDVGLFYYSGHGFQIDGQNYLTGIDSSFFDESSAKYSSIELDRIIELMGKSGAQSKLLILDACRNNPLKKLYRGPTVNGFAPNINPPKGTFISFSTSPGTRAQDFGYGRNSVYTGALLNHIDDINVPIEVLFKRVRATVSTMTDNKQTSWEHTSMIGDFCFNTGQQIRSNILPYQNSVVRDSEFVCKGSEFHEVIKKLKTTNWYVQKSGFDELLSLKKYDLNASDYFLIGRCLLAAAEGGEYSTMEFFNDLENQLISNFGIEYKNVLNGILFEIYFNSNGKFRLKAFKSRFIDQIFEIHENQQFAESFDFIGKQLETLHNYLFFIPSRKPQSVALELLFNSLVTMKQFNKGNFILKSIKYQTLELLEKTDGIDSIEIINFTSLKKRIAESLCIPLKFLTFSTNYDELILDRISVPKEIKLRAKSL